MTDELLADGEPMTQAELNAVPLGLYRVFWQSGGSSLASVGMDYEGKRWVAPTNWTAKVVKGPAALLAKDAWCGVHRLERIHVPDPDEEQDDDRTESLTSRDRTIAALVGALEAIRDMGGDPVEQMCAADLIARKALAAIRSV